MKLRYEINIVSLGILVAVSLAIAFAGVNALDQVTRELNQKLMTNEVKNLVSNIHAAHQVLRDNRVDKVKSYIERTKTEQIQELNNYVFGKTGKIRVIELPDHMVMPTNSLPEDALPATCLAGIAQQKNGTSSCSITGKDHLLRYETYDNWDWTVVLSVETAEILQARDKFLRNVVVILLTSLIAGTILLLWFTEKIVKPVRQLAAAAVSVSNGQWNMPLPTPKGVGEIAQLSRAFQSMARNLSETYIKLQENIQQIAESREELSKRKIFLESVLYHAPDAIIALDAEHCVLDWNPGAERIFGYTQDEAFGKQLDDLVALHQQRAEAGAVTEQVLSGNRVEAFETIRYHKDGSPLHVIAAGTPIMINNSLVGVVAVYTDITTRVQAEEALRRAQRMEAIGTLAGGVAHDFNNMLGVILGYTELAMERVEPDKPLHSNLEKIQAAAQRSADLTRQLLSFARKQTVSPKVIHLNDTVESILKLLRRLIGEDIDLAWQPGREVWPVKIDPTQVDQILTNLCVNARDAIVDTGKVTIETGIASFDEEYCADHAGFVHGDYVLLAVSDNGCGMDEVTQAHLFEPFFTTKEMGKGTGLGLATVYGVVKQNNGFINVYSELGQGTTFKVYLPRHLGKTVPLPEKGLDNPGEQGYETVLLVEDEPTILEMTTGMLERLGYTVLAAGTPGEAIRLAQEHPSRIDLLLTDVVMPEMNGRDLAKNLLSIYPDIRRLFMSGYTANVIAHHGVLDEGVHFIHKPFTQNDLAAKIREALD